MNEIHKLSDMARVKNSEFTNDVKMKRGGSLCLCFFVLCRPMCNHALHLKQAQSEALLNLCCFSLCTIEQQNCMSKRAWIGFSSLSKICSDVDRANVESEYLLKLGHLLPGVG